MLRPDLRVLDAVVTAKYAALEPWWHTYSVDDLARAAAALDRVGVGELSERTFGSLSSGERQRVQLARTLFGIDPSLGKQGLGIDTRLLEQHAKADIFSL